MFDVDPGGTAMDEGIAPGHGRGREERSARGKLSQLVVLTDGETSGEQTCRQLAKQAAQKKIHFTVIGVGTEWNQSLIKDLAKLAEGDWYYIDVNDASAAERIFVEEFEALAATGFLNVEMHLRADEGRQDQARPQVVPEIKELTLTEPEERPSGRQAGHAGARQADALHPRPEPAEAARRQVQHRRHRGHLRPRHRQARDRPARCRWR